MAESNVVQYPLRVPADVMEGLRRIAKRDNESLNRLMVSVLRAYVGHRRQRRKGGRMRWVIDGDEYNTETAAALAHRGRDRYTGEWDNVLYRTPEGNYFMIEVEEGEGTYIRVLDDDDAYDLYLSLPYHLVDEDQAFESEEQEEEAPNARTEHAPAGSATVADVDIEAAREDEAEARAVHTWRTGA